MIDRDCSAGNAGRMLRRCAVVLCPLIVSACATPPGEPAPPLDLACRPSARLVTPVAPDPITQSAAESRVLNLHSIPPLAVGLKCTY